MGKTDNQESSTRLSLRFDREIESFTDKQKLKELITTRLALKEMFQGILQAGKKFARRNMNIMKGEFSLV